MAVTFKDGVILGMLSMPSFATTTTNLAMTSLSMDGSVRAEQWLMSSFLPHRC
jgi:hypothetical protein